MPTLILVLATMIWGCSYGFMKIGVKEISPIEFVFLRSFIAFVLSMPFLFYKKTLLNKEQFYVGLFSSLCTMGMLFFQTKSVKTIPATTSAFISGTIIIFVLIIKYITQKSSPSAKDIFTTSICLLGLFLITGEQLFIASTGIFYSLLGTILAAIHLLIIDKYAKNDSSILIIFIEFFFCTIMSLIALPTLINKLNNISKTAWVAILLSGIFCSFLAYIMQMYSQKFINAKHTALIFILEPVFGTIFPYFYLGEKTISKTFVLGAICILFSITYASFPTKKIKDKSPL